MIDRIYEAGLVPSLWPALLGELGAAVGGNGGFLFGVRDGYTSAVNSVEYDQLMPVFMKDGWSERDPNLPRAIALNRAGFVTDYDLLTAEEIATIKEQISESEDQERPKVHFEVGETVKINDGPFLNFSGVIEEIEPERGKLKVTVNIFGRNTPVELEYWQVEKG